MSDMRPRRSASTTGESMGVEHPWVGRWPDPWTDGRSTSSEELARLRSAVASGTYTAPIDALVDSIVGSMVSGSHDPRTRLR